MQYVHKPPFLVELKTSPSAPAWSTNDASMLGIPEITITAEPGNSEANNFAETETEDLDYSTASCFAAPETTDIQSGAEVSPPHDLIAAIERSERFDGSGFFANRKNQRINMTETAFVLFQALQAGGDEAIKFAIERFPPGLRQRAPSPSKPELLAVQLTAKPATTEERKACSALASLLVVAQALGITCEGYRAWASQIDLADAEVQAKKIRAALKSSAPDEFEGDQIPTPPVYEVQVAVLVDGKPREAVRVVIDDHQTGEVRASIAQARATGELTKLGDELAHLRQNVLRNP